MKNDALILYMFEQGLNSLKFKVESLPGRISLTGIKLAIIPKTLNSKPETLN